MAEQNKFGQKPEGLRCEEWEALLTDALDGLLPAREAAAFRAHSDSCAGCADLLAHAEQGREWLEYLHTEPDVPDGLVGKILDRTMGAGSVPLPVVAGAQGTGAVAMTMPFRRSFQEARLLMTVAMAFFSIALTLNLVLGVKVTSLRLADLRPSAIGSTLSRQFYGARGQVVRYYQNLRFVYQLESRMRELRRDVETPAAGQPQQNKQSQQPKGGQSKAAEQDSVLRAQSTGNGTPTTNRENGATQEANEAGTLEVTEVSNLLGPHSAGLRQAAGNEGRSLA
jgi:Putative zinc-finger